MQWRFRHETLCGALPMQRLRTGISPIDGVLANGEGRTMKPWLGAQEAHYASNLWHLEIINDYVSQLVGATGETRVAPGKSLVNVRYSRATVPSGETAVDLGGHPQFWATDIECATGVRAKMYDFDYARVQEVYSRQAEKRLVHDLTKA